MTALGLRSNITARERCLLTGRVRQQRIHNLVVDAGLNAARDYLRGEPPVIPYFIAVGDGTNAAVAGTVALHSEIYRRVFDRKFKSDKKVSFYIVLGASEANGSTISEIGILARNGTLFAKGILDSPIVKTAAKEVTIIHDMELAAANGVVDAGLNAMRDYLAGDGSQIPWYVAVGTGGAETTSKMVALQNEVYRREIDRRIILSKKITFFIYLSPSEANGNILTEVAILSRNGTMYARTLLDTPIVKDSGEDPTLLHGIELSAVA